MSVQIIHDSRTDVACLHCNTTMRAFGPVLVGGDAVLFAEWWEQYPTGMVDLRNLKPDEILARFRTWEAQPKCTHCEKRVQSVQSFRYEFTVRRRVGGDQQTTTTERLCPPCLEEFKENEPEGKVLP